MARPTLQHVFSLLRFGLVGVSGIVLNVAVFQLLHLLDVPILIASAIGFLAGAAGNYILHRLWTFNRDGVAWKSLVVVSIVLVINAGITHTVAVELGVLPVIAQIIGIICTFPVNWLAHHHWVFEPLLDIDDEHRALLDAEYRHAHEHPAV